MIVPLLFQDLQNTDFRRGIDQVYLALVLLQKAMDAVTRLNKVIEFKPNPKENSLVAVPLKVAPGPGQDRLCCKVFEIAV
jgi:hypothetical protein